MAKAKNDNWLHRDQTKNPYFRRNEAALSVQGLPLLEAPNDGNHRLAQMVSWHPSAALSAFREEGDGRLCGPREAARRVPDAQQPPGEQGGDRLQGNLAFFKDRLQEKFRVYVREDTDPLLTPGEPVVDDALAWRRQCFVKSNESVN